MNRQAVIRAFETIKLQYQSEDERHRVAIQKIWKQEDWIRNQCPHETMGQDWLNLNHICKDCGKEWRTIHDRKETNNISQTEFTDQQTACTGYIGN